MTVLPKAFYEACWTHWCETRSRKSGRNFVVKDKIPIPYFGNIGAYMRSPTRVITVGLNPNREVLECTECRERLKPAETEQRLSRYFAERARNSNWPGWFSNYENILEGMDHSYLSADRGAIHVDLCSPIATDPTWSKLTSKQQTVLREPGRLLFAHLYEMLRPQVVVVSVSRREVTHHWGDPAGTPWRSLVAFPRRADKTLRRVPYDVRYRLGAGRGNATCLVVFGVAAQKPFGKLSADKQRAVGAAIRARFDII